MSLGAIIRRESLRGLVVALLLSFALPYLADWLGVFAGRPWGAGLLGVLFLVGLSLLAIPLWRDRRLVLGGGRLAVFLGYCALFTLATETELLSGPRRALTGFEDALPRNFLALNRFGDWHYRLVGSHPSAEGFVLLLLEPLGSREESRNTFARLIQAAASREARGVAFDYYLEEPSARDAFLCGKIESARAAGIPVLFGYRHLERNGALVRPPLPDSMSRCLGQEDLGSLAGYQEFDGEVRMLPAHFKNDRDQPSLSLRIANVIAGDSLSPPPLTQFVAPRPGPARIMGLPKAADLDLFRDRFLVVGSQREGDAYPTPLGPLAGSEIHLYGAACLAQDRCIARPPAYWTFPSIYLMCFLLALVQARGGGWRPLVVSAAGLSGAVIVIAALTMWVWNLWIEVSYPLTALWVLAALLTAGAMVQGARKRPEDRPAADEARVFDVFLSHSWADKPLVRELADLLEQRGLKVWLDERELRPGQPWQEALEENIESVRSVAVLVGQEDIDRWHAEEMRLALDQSVERKLPVIPVLLPGAKAKPKLPGLLRRFTWVDLSRGFGSKPLDKLEWGITGVKPGHRPAAA